MGGSDSESSGGGGSRARGLVLKALFLFGGALLLKRLSKSTTRWDHARVVAETLSGQKFSREQASRDPDNYFNLRMLMCPATEMVDGSRVLYFEQAFWRTPSKPYRQRFYMVKPCPKEMKCDVELSSYAIRDAEEYKNFCDRSKDQRPQAEEVIGDIAEHLTTIYLSRCERGKRCLYEGSTPAGGFPNSWVSSQHPRIQLTFQLMARTRSGAVGDNGMERLTPHRNSRSTEMVKYTPGIEAMMIEITRSGEQREVHMSSSQPLNLVMMICSHILVSLLHSY